ncbi:MAG TPA: hypothetical protein PK205_07155 [Promineifilum sp.]|nr:hypothetical protein [Promineifilum sp.]
MTKLLMFKSALRLCVPVFDPGKAEWLMENGNVVMRDGNPVLKDATGAERTVGLDTISRLNAENRDFRVRAETAENSLKAFNGLAADKVQDALKALDTVSKLDTKKLIDAGEVDRVRAEIAKGYETQVNEAKAANEQLSGKLNAMIVGNAFANSKFIGDNVAVPRPMFQATFGKNFKVEGDAIVPYDDNGQKIFSKKRMGEIADFDEAVEILVTSSPFKDDILKAPNQRGSGNNGQGGARPGTKYVKRSDFSAMQPHEQAALAVKAKAGEVVITD